MKKLLLLVIILFVSTALQAETIRLASGLNPKSKASKVVERILAEISEESGLDIKVVHLPRKRMFLLVKKSSSKIHGLAFAMDNMDKKFKNLIKVPEMVIEQSIVAVSLRNDIQIKGWKSLKNYKSAYVQGSELIKKKLTKVGAKTHLLDQPEQGLKFISAKRADVFVTTPMIISSFLSKPDYSKLKIVKPQIANYPYYSYFFKKHKDIAERYQQSFKKIKASGVFQKALADLNCKSTI